MTGNFSLWRTVESSSAISLPPHSLTQSLRKFVIIAGLRDVRPLASLHPSNSSFPPDRRHLNRRQLDGPHGVVIANVPLHYLRASPVRTRCKIHGRGNCFSVRWYDLPSTTTSLLFLSASTTAAQRAAVDVNRRTQERGEQAPRSPFPFILLFFFSFVGGSTEKQHTCFWTPSHAYTLTRPVKRGCRASKLTSYFLFLVWVRENGASGQPSTGHRCVAPLRRSPV